MIPDKIKQVRNSIRFIEGEIKKYCPRCKQWKPANHNNYYAKSKDITGFANLCKACDREYSKERSTKARLTKDIYRNNKGTLEILCRDCGEWKEANKDNFHLGSKSVLGFYTSCKLCTNKKALTKKLNFINTLTNEINLIKD